MYRPPPPRARGVGVGLGVGVGVGVGSDSPLRIVIPLRVTFCTVERILKTRSWVTEPLPSMIVAPEPAPWIVISCLRSRSPTSASSSYPTRVIRYKPDGTMIVLGPATTLACTIAARSVQTPVDAAQMPSAGSASGKSAVLFTTYVLAASAGLASATKMSPTASAEARLANARRPRRG